MRGPGETPSDLCTGNVVTGLLNLKESGSDDSKGDACGCISPYILLGSFSDTQPLWSPEACGESKAAVPHVAEALWGHPLPSSAGARLQGGSGPPARLALQS